MQAATRFDVPIRAIPHLLARLLSRQVIVRPLSLTGLSGRYCNSMIFRMI
ncbi:hypothetical protein DEU52_10262 [Ensifer adhaerens]|nr:hypothetical protein DEU52_10262 [Ensifer adhaerens]